jgi:hypothetical protein
MRKKSLAVSHYPPSTGMSAGDKEIGYFPISCATNGRGFTFP